jgi:single-strand DNA-binding protein
MKMKQIFLSGNLTKDAELRRTQSGEPVLGFDIAVNDNRTKTAIFFQCSMWGKRGDAIKGYLTKGTKVSVVGDLGTREHNGKTYLTVNVSELTLMGGGEKRDERDSYGNEPKKQTRQQAANFANALDDDIPFLMEWR